MILCITSLLKDFISSSFLSVCKDSQHVQTRILWHLPISPVSPYLPPCLTAFCKTPNCTLNESGESGESSWFQWGFFEILFSIMLWIVLTHMIFLRLWYHLWFSSFFRGFIINVLQRRKYMIIKICMLKYYCIFWMQLIR